MLYYIFKPTMSLFDIMWIIVAGLLGSYFAIPWLIWVVIVPMMAVSIALTNKFVK